MIQSMIGPDVFIMFLSLLSYFVFTSQSETVKSQESASLNSSTSIRFRADLIDINIFSLVVIPTDIYVENMEQSLVESVQR